MTSRLTSTRGGAIVVGVLAAVIAAVLLVVYVTHYRKSVKSDTAPVQVLVAKRLITAGTTGTDIGKKQLYTLTSVPKAQVIEGALPDPGTLNGQVAAVDIFPGAQMTAADFTAAGASGDTSTGTGLTASLKATQRAVAIQIDALSGNLGNLTPGDHVDIYQEVKGRGGTAIKLFRANVPVLQVNATGDPSGGAATGQVVLGISAKDAADVLFAAKHTPLSFALRPAKGSSATPAEIANNQSMLQFSRTH